MGRVVAALAATALLAAPAAGLSACGEDETPTSAAPTGERSGEGGTLAFALAAAPEQLDPLLAEDHASQLLSRQIHEPLVDTVTGPFGDVRQLPGLAQAYSPSGDRAIWRFELREHVRFQDGSPFNASAVVANTDRWLASAEGQELLPNLVAVDAPRPDLVRFILDGPDPEFPRRLSVPQLGIVSPEAIRSSPEAPLSRTHRTGTGPFELRLLEADGALIVRYVDWWGARLQLGPALDQIELPVVPDETERVELLTLGEIEIADQLGAATVRELDIAPLLTYEGGLGGPYIGFERSARGIEISHGVAILSGVWLTTVGVGE